MNANASYDNLTANRRNVTTILESTIINMIIIIFLSVEEIYNNNVTHILYNRKMLIHIALSLKLI